MAIVRSIGIGRAKGSIGDITYKVRGGKTVASFKVDKKGRGGSFRQTNRRAQWGNIVNVWQSFSGNLHPSFESSNKLVSDFNNFMRANLGLGIYLTAEQVRMGGALAAGYVVTEGSLPSISVVAGTGDVPRSSIALGTLTLGPSTTLQNFSQAVINNNSDFREGDQITVFVMKQTVNADTQVPYITLTTQELTLNIHDEETLLSDVVSAEGFSAVDNYLGNNSTVDGSIVWIHSRLENGKTLVSTQRMYVSNSILANFMTSTMRDEAIASYNGKAQQDYLTPNIDELIVPVTP